MKKCINNVFALVFLFVSTAQAQDMFRYFKPEDFEKRRARVLEKIGNGVAVLQGANAPEGYLKFRQDNNFYYLTGVETPGAVLILNGKTKTSTLLVPDQVSNDIKVEARITPNSGAAPIYKFTNVVSKNNMTTQLTNLYMTGADFYVLTTPEEQSQMTRSRCLSHRTAIANDPWDGRISKEVAFINNLKNRFPLIQVKSLTPILDDMRWVKDEKEIAVLRICGELAARGFDEAMRVTKPGMYEYQVVAATDFVYCNGGAFGPAYFAIAAAGLNGLNWHYNANNHKLKKGELFYMDYAPEVHYYATDITRTWPVEGEFTPIQLKYYNCVKEVSEKVIAAMKPGITVEDMTNIAKEVFIRHGFEKLYRKGIGHFVGMSVHDVGDYSKPFVPGVVFNVEPIIEDKALGIHVRIEDTVLITATGAENLTKSTPTDPAAIYKLMQQQGLGQ